MIGTVLVIIFMLLFAVASPLIWLYGDRIALLENNTTRMIAAGVSAAVAVVLLIVMLIMLF